MGERTGRPRGRPPGARNKRTEAVQAAAQTAAEAIQGAIPEAFLGDAHALLMAVYKDPKRPIELRVDAAKAAVKFEKPALSSIEAKVAMTLDDLDDAALNREIAREAAAAGLISGGESSH